MFTKIQLATFWLIFWVTFFLSSFVIYTEYNQTIIANILAIYVWDRYHILRASLPMTQLTFVTYWLAANGPTHNILTFSFTCFLLLVALFQIFLVYKLIRAFIKAMIVFSPRPNPADDMSISTYLSTITHEILQPLGLNISIPNISPETTITLQLLFWTIGVGICTFLTTKSTLATIILFLAPYMDPLEPWFRAQANDSEYPYYSHLLADEMLLQRAYNLPYDRPMTITLLVYRIFLSVLTVVMLYKFSMSLEVIVVRKWNQGKVERKMREMVKVMLDEIDVEHVDVFAHRTSDMKGVLSEAWDYWVSAFAFFF